MFHYILTEKLSVTAEKSVNDVSKFLQKAPRYCYEIF